MENILNLTPVQSLFIVALNVWMFVIFPVIIIKKINYLTAIIEAQFLPEDQDNQES
jgi:hypothetical protein